MKQQHITRHVIGRHNIGRHIHIIGRTSLAILASALLATAAFAAGPSGTRVVRDPETGRTRVVNPNVDPFGGFAAPATPGSNQAPIILRMPKPHRAAPRKPKVAKTPAPETAAQEAPAPEASITEPAPETPTPAATQPAPPPRKAAPKAEAKVAKPAPAAPAQSTGGIPFSLSGDNAAAPPPPEPAQNTAAAATGTPGNVHINFGAGAVAPTPEAAAALKSIAGNYANEMAGGANRLLLEAYAGTKGDKSSEARRLSLKRALAVRQLLIDAGVPSDRIDVRALGGADSGNQDRVDISMHS